MNKIINGNSLIELKNLQENSIDSIVTDPPYELGFMGKSWDSTGIANNVELWKECLRVLKPGGHLLAFSGTRTYHRMASAIEDAGFEVRDMIEWVYGSGFPKSLNIGKAVDKLQGNEKFKEQEIGFVKWLKSNLDCYWCSGLGVISDNEEGFGDPSSCLDCKGKGKYIIEDIDEWLGTKAQAFHFFAESDSNRQIPNAETYKILKNRLHLDNRYDNFVKKHSLLLEEIREVQGYEKSIKNWDKKYDKAILNKPKTELASEWEGWGTALKPAHEPICMARKPLAEKTVAENVLKYGTGGINIDESRVEGEPTPINKLENWSGFGQEKRPDYVQEINTQGRFPANLIHDNSEEVRECFPEAKGMSGGGKHKQTYNKEGVIAGGGHDGNKSHIRGDSGNASRFFKSIPIEEQDEIQEECTDMEEKLEALGISQIEEKTDISPTIYKSILYQAKASKSERNKGCEEMPDKRVNYMAKANGTGEASMDTFSSISKNYHPTVKPIALMEYLIKMVTKPGGIVLDPFAGSGTTAIACINTNRKYILMEKEPEYIEIINKRIAKNAISC